MTDPTDTTALTAAPSTGASTSASAAASTPAPTMLSLASGFHYEQLTLGARFVSRRRTVTEADLVAFVNASWLTEALFTDASDRSGMAIEGRVVPGALVYAFAEGLVAPSMQGTGLAFLHAEIDVHGPTLVGDTLQVECEVVERRTTSKPGRGLVRTRNRVTNQQGRAVLTYTPLRMMRMAGAAGAVSVYGMANGEAR